MGVIECGGGELLNHLGSALLTLEVPCAEPELFDLVISDVRMPVVSGLSILEGIFLFDNLPTMISITAFGDDVTHAKAKQFGAASIFDKPFELKTLMRRVREVLSYPKRNTSRRGI